MASLRENIDFNNLPRHIAVIMDGNGRWAKRKGAARIFGHRNAIQAVKDVTEGCGELGIKYLTLYAFSTENWSRPKSEVDFLMKLLEKYLDKETPFYAKHEVKFKTVGDISKFSPALIKRIESVKEATKKHKKLTQILAINYGSKDEIIRAANTLVSQDKEITEDTLTAALDTGGVPSVDMLIRTGGEKRLSNFLLWQSAYAELFFTKTLWPDFGEEEFFGMIEEFKNRERRFGKI